MELNNFKDLVLNRNRYKACVTVLRLSSWYVYNMEHKQLKHKAVGQVVYTLAEYFFV